MSTSLNEPLVVGRIDYANAWPLFHHLDSLISHSDTNIQVVSKVPALLNQMLQEGSLQVSAISSFSYGKNSEDYVLLPNLSVGSEGNVHSILLILKEQIETNPPKRIAVTTTSATSVNLLKILMKKYYELDPVYEPAEPDLDSMLENADAALLIGDTAIHASWEKKGRQVIDLGGVWNAWTGLAMTYAVVAARKETAELYPAALRSLYEAMLASKRLSLSDLSPLVDKACQELGGAPAYWNMYFTNLQYHFGRKQQEGLSLYFRYAKELGLLDQDAALRFIYEDESAE